MGRGLRRLGKKRGVLLVQLPPQMELNLERLAGFLELVAVSQRVAIEFRHPTWHVEPVFSLLAEHGAAYCVTSGADLPCILRTTADFVYVRLHGPDRHKLYVGSYPDDDLHRWAARIGEWRDRGRDVFAYFNNDGYGHAVRNAESLRLMLGE
jgi:uncharacterized protein YecE (DUF72 family)